MANIVFSIIVSYLLGSIPFGFLIARAKGIDIREHGSRNIGATNVKRVLGKGPGYTTLALDILKGYVAVTLCPMLFYTAGAGVSKELLQLLCAVSVIAGHSWTVFLKFKGGKGVATATGAFFGIAPVPLLCAAAVYGISAKVTKYVSVSSMLGAVSFVVFAWMFGMSIEIKVFGIIVAAIIVLRHRTNIKRLIDGTENKIGQKTTE